PRGEITLLLDLHERPPNTLFPPARCASPGGGSPEQGAEVVDDGVVGPGTPAGRAGGGTRRGGWDSPKASQRGEGRARVGFLRERQGREKGLGGRSGIHRRRERGGGAGRDPFGSFGSGDGIGEDGQAQKEQANDTDDHSDRSGGRIGAGRRLLFQL